MSIQLLILRGVPGSGKTTYATRWMKEDPINRVRVNRDDIRHSVFGSHVLDISQEAVITKIETAMIEAALGAKRSVVVDSQNLRAANVLKLLALAAKHSAVALHKDFYVDLDVALARNNSRERRVPEDVLRKNFMKYSRDGRLVPFPVLQESEDKTYYPDKTLPKAIILDVDGTAMKMNGRGPFEWHRVLEDTPNAPVIATVQSLAAQGYLVIVMSGREDIDSCREDTLLSLEAAGVSVHELHMRAAGDGRKDSIVKMELFDAHIRERFNVLLALDDRDQVVDMYRQQLGLSVFQVDYGNF